MFKANHFDLIKSKIVDIFYHTTDQLKLEPILKTMFVAHKIKSFTHDEELKKKLE
jgi:hypothetical protein